MRRAAPLTKQQIKDAVDRAFGVDPTPLAMIEAYNFETTRRRKAERAAPKPKPVPPPTRVSVAGALRPMPPEIAFDAEAGAQFIPAPGIVEWARSTFIDPDATLFNAEHEHLANANIGALWTNVPNAKNGKAIIGQCEIGDPMAMGKWAKAKARLQVEQWFGDIPDFILTFDAAYASVCSDIEWCALVEHELLHGAQDIDEYGSPKFSKTGRPIFGIRGHDVQEFVSIVRRYGADAAHVRAMVDAGHANPEIGSAGVMAACGTCLRRGA